MALTFPNPVLNHFKIVPPKGTLAEQVQCFNLPNQLVIQAHNRARIWIQTIPCGTYIVRT